MKLTTILCLAIPSLCLLQCQALAEHSLLAGARYQTRHSQYIALPFNNGDMTYQLGYEYKEANAFWQILAGYTPSISEGSDGRGVGVDYVITPQLNLLFEDRNWLAGVGILASYITVDKTEEAENKWTDVYWQVMFGYQIPLRAFHIELMAYYPFEKWSTFGDFKGSDMEYSILLKRTF